MFKGKVLLFSLLVVFATSVYAGEVDQCLSSAGISTVMCTDTLEFSICPAGDFEYISDACGGDADYIWVEVLNGGGLGVEGIPWTDFWLNGCDPANELYLCINPIQADSLTNEDGHTTFSDRMAGGGCMLSGGMYVAVQGKIIEEETSPGSEECIDILCMPVVVTSPDNVAEYGLVDSVDFSLFAKSYNKGPGDAMYQKCSDFTNDDFVGVIDFSLFAKHYYHECF